MNTLTIRHTVTFCEVDGKRVLVASGTAKTKSSWRTLPLVLFVRERLLDLKAEQEENRRVFDKGYNKEYIGYVCVNSIGNLILPHYITDNFKKFLSENDLREIRFYDLRHSCASLMLASGVPMKQIQKWLGHSGFSTTANIYAHFEFSSKISSADSLLRSLKLGANPCLNGKILFFFYSGKKQTKKYKSSRIQKRKSQQTLEFTGFFWRKRWDSNPRTLAGNLISSQGRYDHFDTLP